MLYLLFISFVDVSLRISRFLTVKKLVRLFIVRFFVSKKAVTDKL